MNIKVKIIKSISWLIVLLVAVLFVQALARDWSNVQDTLQDMSWTSWLSVVFFVTAVAVSGILWGRLVYQLGGRKVQIVDAVRIHSASWLLKYVPGQVGSLINKIAWAHKQGLSKKSIGATVIYENVLMVFASILLSVPLLWSVGAEALSNGTILLSALVVLPMLIVLNQTIFYKVLNTALKLARRKPIEKNNTLTSLQIAKNTIGYAIPRSLNGVGFVVIAAAILPVTPDMFVSLASIYILAGVVGMLALFVPSGLGVREGVIVVLASFYFAPEQAIVLSLVARFFATVADIGVFAVYIILNKGRIVQQ